MATLRPGAKIVIAITAAGLIVGGLFLSLKKTTVSEKSTKPAEIVYKEHPPANKPLEQESSTSKETVPPVIEKKAPVIKAVKSKPKEKHAKQHKPLKHKQSETSSDVGENMGVQDALKTLSERESVK